ncbi:MAG: AbrB/MazE/SpoVT family DNA-binding domain-containing protein [Planctomycetota bacterium]
MTTIKITSKRQTVLPRQLCDEMHVGPGDRLEVRAVTVQGERAWVLLPVRDPELPAFGMLEDCLVEEPPSWEKTRDALDDAWAEGEGE